jgi:hypothetical protein
MGLIPEEIARKFGHLSLAQVHAALAYYHANKAEIEILSKVVDGRSGGALLNHHSVLEFLSF